MLRKIFTYVILILTLIPNTLGEVLADDELSLHSLADLPYRASETFDSRRTLLEDDRTMQIPSEEDSFDPSVTLSEASDTLRMPINFDAANELDSSFMTVLAEKRVFEKKQEMLVPTFLTNPFMTDFSKDTTLLDLFLSSGSVGNTEILTGTSLLQEQESSLSPAIGRKIVVGKKAIQKRHIPGVRGMITYEVLPGTIITSASGDIIDTSKIGTEKLDISKKQQAKVKYEKKMKNRGTLKKGRSEAQVEGFEFGLSGTHLLFSKPVMLTIDTPHMSDGNIVDLLTLHEGDRDFHTGGLSTSPDTLCNPDGSASIPGSQPSVKNGKVTFYTCGASSFIMNPSGGTAGSNDLRIIIGDCAQVQIYYNNLTQIYTGNPPATGCSTNSTMDSWPVLRIGGTSYGNDFSAWSTQTTTGATNGNTYTATSTMTRVVGALTYTLIIDWSHTAPNTYLTWSWRVITPPTNTLNVRFYYGMDSMVAGNDTNDVGYYSLTGGQTIGIYDNVANILSAFRYLSGITWTAYQADRWNTVRAQIANGADFTNFIDTAGGDLGFGVDWDLGTTPGTYSGTVEWRLTPYVAGNVPDLIPGIGQPEGPLTTYLLSQLPINVTNVGNATSTGLHTVIFTVPTNITGPSTSFVDNGWTCGAQVGTGVTCTKTTTISTPLGVETVRIPVTPTLAASGTSVTFNVRITNPGDSNTTNNTAFAMNAVVGGPAPNDPGGVTGENLWLRADGGTNCTTTGCTITTWTNLGGLGAPANAVTGLGTVTYDPINRVNGNPTLYFNNASLNTNNTLGITAAAVSIFTVTRVGSLGEFVLGTQSGALNALDWSTTPLLDRFRLYPATDFYNGANMRSASVPAITSTIRMTGGASTNSTNGRQTLSSATPITSFAANSIGIGRVNITNSTLSNVGEVIVYNTGMTSVNKNKVESYLALKYGITLDQTTATNYTLSSSDIIWNATLAGAYKNDIAGIARDDTSGLSQIRSQTINNTGDFIVSKSSIATNRLALTWANDAGATAAFTPVDSPTGFQRIPREWLFQEKNGDIGTINVSYPVSAVPVLFTAPLYLLTNASTIFATGTTAYTGTYNTGTSMWDFSLSIADMQYVTFAQGVSTDSTPPVINSTNIASGTLIPTSNFTLIVGYSDTGSAISPSSFTGRIYLWDSTGSTWSLTNIAPSYMSITGTTTTSTGQLQVSGIPFGKYRFDILISDTAGNTLTQSYTYFVDAVIWTISAPLYPIGSAPLGASTFGSGEIIITIETVGAGFDLSMIRTTDLTYITDIIPVYSGSTGWGYSQWNGTSFPPTITPHGTSQSLASVTKNINVNGQRNTFTYRVKYGVNPSANTPAGDYSGMMRFGINLTY